MTPISLNLNKSSQTYSFTTNELLQPKQFAQFDGLISSILEHKDALKSANLLDEIRTCQVHDAIFISGKRGSGKTTFLNSLETYLTEKPVGKKITFLPVIDPTLLHHNEEFLVIALAQIFNFTEKKLCNVPDEITRQYYQKIKEVTDAIAERNGVENDKAAIERVINSQHSLKLEQHVHELLELVAKLCATELLVFPIDDIDMSFDHGFDVLETIRKFLSSPHIVPVVSGDYEQYATIVNKQFSEQVQSPFLNAEISGDEHASRKDGLSPWMTSVPEPDRGFTSKNWLEKVEKMTERYFKKVFPSHQRIKLPSLKEILIQQPDLEIGIDGETYPFSCVYYGIIDDFNYPMKAYRGALADEHTCNPVPMESLRATTQFLKKLQPYIKQHYWTKNNEEDPNADEKKGELSDSERSAFFGWIAQALTNIEEMRFVYLAAEAGIAIHEEKYMKQLLFSDFFDPGINPHGKPVLEPIEKDFSGNNGWFVSKSTMSLLKLGPARLLIHNNYVSGVGTRNFVVAGKYYELMLRSLDESPLDFAEEIVEGRQQTRMGRGSPLLDIPHNTYIKHAEDGDEEAEDDDDDDEDSDESTRSNRFNWETIYRDEEIESLKSWNLEAKKCRKPSPHYVYKVVNKAMYNLYDMYTKVDANDETLPEILERMKWILLNSVAFFEQVNDKSVRVSDKNIGISKRPPTEEHLRKYDNAFQMNIQELLSPDSPSLTKLLYDNPVFRVDGVKTSLEQCRVGAKKDRILDKEQEVSLAKSAHAKMKLLLEIREIKKPLSSWERESFEELFHQIYKKIRQSHRGRIPLRMCNFETFVEKDFPELADFCDPLARLLETFEISKPSKIAQQNSIKKLYALLSEMTKEDAVRVDEVITENRKEIEGDLNEEHLKGLERLMTRIRRKISG